MNYYLLIFIFFALLFDKLNIFFYLILSSVLHETGHICACWFLGAKPKTDISVFGIKLKNYPETPIKKLMVIVCGPLTNLVLIFISKALLSCRFSLDTYVFMTVNIIIFLFNCLPVYFLDGGQIIALVCSGSFVRTILDIFSFILILTTIFFVSENKTISILFLGLFIIYYFINKKTAFY